MKKIYLLSFALFSAFSSIKAQSSLTVVDVNNGMAPVLNNAVINYTTVANDHITTEIDATNTSASTKYYKLRRFDDVLNAGSNAYFCVGSANCYPPTTYTSVVTITLTAGQSLSSINQNLLLEIEEPSTTPGYSSIRYQIYNVNDANDVFTLTLKYNDTGSSIKESSDLFSSVSNVYPSPAINKAYINVNANSEINNVTLTVTNSLGSIVSTKNINLSSGKNNITIDSEPLASGIYFATILSGNTKIVKKFTINK